METDRPSLRSVVWRSAVVTCVTALALWLLAVIVPGFSIESGRDALLAGFVVGLGNAIIWPALAFLVVPLSVLTLGLGAIVLNVVFVGWLLDLLPGVEIDGFWASLWVVVGLVVVTTAIGSSFALDDLGWVDQRVARQARRRSNGAIVTDVPGIVFIQLDGVAHAVLRRAPSSGMRPASLDPWRQPHPRGVGEGGRRTASASADPDGSTVDMPAFPWIDKITGDVFVSNHPKYAARIERAHSTATVCWRIKGRVTENRFPGDAE